MGWGDQQELRCAMREKSKAEGYVGEYRVHVAHLEEFSMHLPCQRGIFRWTQVINREEKTTQVDMWQEPRRLWWLNADYL